MFLGLELCGETLHTKGPLMHYPNLECYEKQYKHLCNGIGTGFLFYQLLDRAFKALQ